jgi:hypothetical protein
MRVFEQSIARAGHVDNKDYHSISKCDESGAAGAKSNVSSHFGKTYSRGPARVTRGASAAR